MKHNILGVIWDWNGTLLNDVEYSVQSFNALLERRNLPRFSIDTYRSVFTFPVIEYYKLAGFNFEKEQWEAVAMEFMEVYWSDFDKLQLNDGVIDTLKQLKKLGIKNYILSAMEDSKLNYMLKSRSLLQYFDVVAGIKDHYAHSKQDVGIEMVNNLDLPRENLLMVGDTIHDVETAQAMGVSSILFTHGHQHPDRFSHINSPKIYSISEIVNYIL